MYNTRFSQKEKISFVKRLAFLLEAEISLKESLMILVSHAQNRKKVVLQEISNDVSAGKYLAESLEKFPYFLSPVACSLIKSGEESGLLPINLHRLAQELEQQRIITQTIISALIYPAFIALTTILLTCFLLFIIFPKIKPLFVSLGARLPLSTRILLFISTLLQRYALFLIIFNMIIFCVYVYLYKKNIVFKEYIDTCILYIPIISTLLSYYYIRIISQTISALLLGGDSIDQALLSASYVCNNSCFKNHLAHASKKVTLGYTVVGSLKNNILFPDYILDMLEAGEHSGSLAEIFSYISELSKHEITESMKNLTSILEPLLMICMGLVVGFIALSIITPIYTLTQSIHH